MTGSVQRTNLAIAPTPTKADQVQVYELGVPVFRPYTVLGTVRTTASYVCDKEDKLKKFREGAAELGADAIIIEEMPDADWLGSFYPGKGKAIKWQ